VSVESGHDISYRIERERGTDEAAHLAVFWEKWLARFPGPASRRTPGDGSSPARRRGMGLVASLHLGVLAAVKMAASTARPAFFPMTNASPFMARWRKLFDAEAN